MVPVLLSLAASSCWGVADFLGGLQSKRVPVPVVLQKKNVKTLPKEIFDHVDQLTSPRLVEYWEQDPCEARVYKRKGATRGAATGRVYDEEREDSDKLGVFVGDYRILVQRDSGVDYFQGETAEPPQ